MHDAKVPLTCCPLPDFCLCLYLHTHYAGVCMVYVHVACDIAQAHVKARQIGVKQVKQDK